MDLSRPLTDRHDICTQVWCGISAKNLLSKIFLSTLKIWQGNLKFTSNYRGPRQSKPRYFEMAQHIDKQKTDISSTINTLQNVPNVGPSPHGVLMT